MLLFDLELQGMTLRFFSSFFLVPAVWVLRTNQELVSLGIRQGGLLTA